MASVTKDRHVQWARALRGLVVLLGSLASTPSLASPFGGGSGTSDDPYQIKNWHHLAAIGPHLQDLSAGTALPVAGAKFGASGAAALSSDQYGSTDSEAGRYFELQNDLNEASSGYATHVIDGDTLANGGQGWKPIGDDNGEFGGFFDGGGHSISDFLVLLGTDDPSNKNLGLFAVVGPVSEIKRLSVEGEVKGNTALGLLAGENYGLIKKVHAHGEVRGNESVGVLVGHNFGVIEEAFTTGDAGGLGVGGLVGANDSFFSSDALIKSSYSTATVRGDFAAGLVGVNGGSITNSYSTGQVIPDGDGGSATTGGLVAVNNIDGTTGTVTDSYWDQDSSGADASAAGEGKSTAQMKSSQTFSSWDFSAVWAIEENAVVSYPYLQSPTQSPAPGRVEYFAGGTGAEKDPYQIKNWHHLAAIGPYLETVSATSSLPVASAKLGASGGFDRRRRQPGSGKLTTDDYFELQNDLDETTTGYTIHVADGDTLANSGAGWKPIDLLSFGVFDGGGHLISGLKINRPSETGVGLFKVNEGEIKRLGLAGTIAGPDNASGGGDDAVGLLVGDNAGVINETYTQGVVIGSSRVGGLAGFNIGVVENSYASVEVTGDTVAGLVGQNTGSITNSYSTGLVTPAGDKRATYGGLVAQNQSNDGNLKGQVVDSYWDEDSSLTGISDGGEGKTTAQMKSSQTFFSSWDFSTVWAIEENAVVSYPYLQNATQSPSPGRVEYFAGGDGSQSSPFEIKTWAHLSNIREQPAKQYQLMNDLSSSTAGYAQHVANNGGLVNNGQGWAPIPGFKGTLSGQSDQGDFEIKGLKIDRPSGSSPVGLFADIRPMGLVTDLAFESAEVVGNASVGVVAGSSAGVLLRVRASGSVQANSSAGGLLGSLTFESGKTEAPAVERSVSMVDVSTTSGSVGGLIGLVGAANSAFVLDSYATGSVTGSDSVGGLVGVMDKSIVRRNYAAGQVKATASAPSHVGGLIGQFINTNNMSENFFDMEATGQSNKLSSQAGTGRSTAAMKEKTTFTDAGWDFTANTGVWAIQQSNATSYPYLRAMAPASVGTSSTGLPLPGLVKPPAAPTIGQAVASDGQAEVAFTAPNDTGGGTITGFTATSTPGGISATTAETHSGMLTVAGLNNGTRYTFTVTASNAAGSGPPSSPSNAVTPQGVPAAPTALSARSGAGSIRLTFNQPDNGGAAVTNHQYSFDDGNTWTSLSPPQATSPVTVSGLVNDTEYALRLRAVNSVGIGPASELVMATPSASKTQAEAHPVPVWSRHASLLLALVTLVLGCWFVAGRRRFAG
ncbi:MAG: fibronectin type III domain-containing protein [Wenzhouxiangella sp.]|nr:fibronectin type III domain-containing protein [Wenzhouxiangella sp.]